MPLGVPKVPTSEFEFDDDYGYFPNYSYYDDDEGGPKKKKKEWIDLFNRLQEDRIIFVFNDFKDEATNLVIGLMLLLADEEPEEAIYLYINSSGGHVINGIAIHNMMTLVEAGVYTLGMGKAASMAAFVLASGTRKRAAFPNTRVMIHQPQVKFSTEDYETSLDMIGDAEYVMHLRLMIADYFAQRGKKPVWMVFDDMERDFFMTAHEAVDYGIIDFVMFEDDDEDEDED
uniref:ATP-dependent Clp protease proteolytic subunit n=1 Tax=Lobelia linearis TaxID=2041131 RepID=A0A291EZ57_9ASTR|nr:ATP-dependent protease proteolytic subunit [Lobelia linearis]ATG25162.1 ATP-dependent protease proteolytic subunit [Lobelia linearis]